MIYERRIGIKVRCKNIVTLFIWTLRRFTTLNRVRSRIPPVFALLAFYTVFPTDFLNLPLLLNIHLVYICVYNRVLWLATPARIISDIKSLVYFTCNLIGDCLRCYFSSFNGLSLEIYENGYKMSKRVALVSKRIEICLLRLGQKNWSTRGK